ncbi:MAG: Foldase protein PrsA 1 precursor [Verrucomicrobia bacterium ADurb.Bin345]|nr:MAG: Foldase protein PrsA 1 precursor [Verrucomicrobia bacterium ADurb.Bin345]
MNRDRWIRMMLAVLLVLPLACALVGCGKAEKKAETGVDLSKPGDLFDSPVKAPQAVPPETVLVVVNGTSITRGEVDAELGRMMQMASRRVPPDRLELLRDRFQHQAVESLILKNVLTEAVGANGVVVTDEDVAEAMTKFRENLPPGMTLEQILEMNNWSQEEFDRNLRMDLSINKLLEQNVEEVKEPTDEELGKFYEENAERFDVPETVSARHILVAVETTDTQEQRDAKKAKAEELREKLVAGSDFAEVAAESSDCPSKTRGGDLGTFGRGQMVQPFEEAAFTQKIDEIGPVVETQFGYHIIQVQKHEDPRRLALDDVKERLGKGLHAQKRQEAAQKYVAELKKKSNIEYKDASLKPREIQFEMGEDVQLIEGTGQPAPAETPAPAEQAEQPQQ